MPRIRFTADPKLPRDIAHLGYRKDQEIDLPLDEANRWLRRGVAETVESPVAVVEPVVIAPETLASQVPASDAEVSIPDNWESMHHMQRVSLARRLTTNSVDGVAAADAVINAELDRRTSPSAA